MTQKQQKIISSKIGRIATTVVVFATWAHSSEEWWGEGEGGGRGGREREREEGGGRGEGEEGGREREGGGRGPRSKEVKEQNNFVECDS